MAVFRCMAFLPIVGVLILQSCSVHPRYIESNNIDYYSPQACKLGRLMILLLELMNYSNIPVGPVPIQINRQPATYNQNNVAPSVPNSPQININQNQKGSGTQITNVVNQPVTNMPAKAPTNTLVTPTGTGGSTGTGNAGTTGGSAHTKDGGINVLNDVVGDGAQAVGLNVNNNSGNSAKTSQKQSGGTTGKSADTEDGGINLLNGLIGDGAQAVGININNDSGNSVIPSQQQAAGAASKSADTKDGGINVLNDVIGDGAQAVGINIDNNSKNSVKTSQQQSTDTTGGSVKTENSNTDDCK